MDTTNAFVAQGLVNPLNPPASVTQGPGEVSDDEFTANANRSLFWSILRYARAILTIFWLFLLDLTRSSNKSLVSKIVRISLTIFAYAIVYTITAGQLLWAIAYLMDHGWYLLAATCSVVVLFISGIFLVICEWMWLWQGRVLSYLCSHGRYERLRSVNILDDDEMGDDLTLRGWVKQIVHVFVSCLIWSLYCALNVKIDFWITENFPIRYAIVLRIVNCFEAAPILLGAAILLYYAYPSFYSWNFTDDRVLLSGIEDIDNGRYSIETDENNAATIGAGTQNLII